MKENEGDSAHTPPPHKKTAEKKHRLAQALRENLRKRKEQLRLRKSAEGPRFPKS
jgi:hypothetical protein